MQRHRLLQLFQLDQCGDGETQAGCGEECDDGNVDNGDGCGATCLTETTLACGPAPLTGCRRPVRSDKASLLIKRGSTLFKDQLKWLWLAGERTTLADYGNPLGATQYQLCLYDNTGLRLDANVPTGGLCAGKPCWKAVGTSGFRYGERPHARRRPKVNLKSGSDGKRRSSSPCAAPTSDYPTSQPWRSPVTVQIKNSNGTCWGGDLQRTAAKPVEHDLQGQTDEIIGDGALVPPSRHAMICVPSTAVLP